MRLNLLKLALIMFVVCVLSGIAQKWNFGVEAGYVANTLAVEEYESTARNGFKFRVDAEYILGNHISFESGITYIRKGATASGDNMWSYRSSYQYCLMTVISVVDNEPVMALSMVSRPCLLMMRP